MIGYAVLVVILSTLLRAVWDPDLFSLGGVFRVALFVLVLLGGWEILDRRRSKD
jgi:hypothetical protein